MSIKASVVPWPKTDKELLTYLDSLRTPVAEGKGDLAAGYEASADALWKGAAATFYYLSHVFGVTGFQAGYAGLKFLAEVRSMKAPFMIVDAEKLLYPQYNLIGDVENFLHEQERGWASDEAKTCLAEHREVHPDVARRWRYLASLKAPK